MWVSFAAWALGSGEQSKRTPVPQANAASGAGCPGWWACVPARQPASPTPSPSSPCCSCWAPRVAWCLRPRGSGALSTWRQKDMELDVVCEMRGAICGPGCLTSTLKGSGKGATACRGFQCQACGKGLGHFKAPL